MTRPATVRSLRAAADRLRVSFFVGVALVPTLVSLVFAHVESLLPWGWWLSYTLLPVPPGLRRAYLVVGEVSVGARDLDGEIAQLLASARRPGVAAEILGQVPVTDLDNAVIEALADKLGAVRHLLGPDDRIIVDVTAGTVPMSLATYRAAVQADLPVTYTSSIRDAVGRYTFRELISVHDPLDAVTRGGE
ncbi:MAG TPA: hypothetical protein VI248_05950 [Kineosporiaceae bacterium]